MYVLNGSKAGCVLVPEGLLKGGLELSKWIITCLCTEVSWHSWILQDPGSSAGEVYRITFELFEDLCPFWDLKHPVSLKHDTLMLLK